MNQTVLLLLRWNLCVCISKNVRKRNETARRRRFRLCAFLLDQQKKHLHKMGEEKLKSVFYAGKQACCERFFMPDYTWNMVIFRHLPITTRWRARRFSGCSGVTGKAQNLHLLRDRRTSNLHSNGHLFFTVVHFGTFRHISPLSNDYYYLRR